MLEKLTLHEPQVRFAAFASVLAVMWFWEWRAARRATRQSKPKRWLANFSILLADTLVQRLVLPASVVGVAILAAERGWGLWNVFDAPSAVAVLGSVLLLDLAIYGQHVLFHAVPLLWRLHMVHHTDEDVDVSTGLRFHPFEIVLSLGIKIAVVLGLGVPASAVVLFEVLLNATSMFNHGNVRLPRRLDRVLRWILVTPDMHRVHHSVRVEETNSNYGFNLVVWDRLFGTYRAQPADSHESMRLGVEEWLQERPRGLIGLLGLPFRRRPLDPE